MVAAERIFKDVVSTAQTAVKLTDQLYGVKITCEFQEKEYESKVSCMMYIVSQTTLRQQNTTDVSTSVSAAPVSLAAFLEKERHEIQLMSGMWEEQRSLERTSSDDLNVEVSFLTDQVINVEELLRTSRCKERTISGMINMLIS